MSQPPATSYQSSRVFVGRERELEELRVGLGEAVRGRGCLFVVAGEPGIGKTRLCDELAAKAEAHGFQVLWGRCWEGGGAPPFWPWVQIVRAYMHGRPPETLADQLGAGAADVAHMVPELLATFPDPPRAATVEDEAARFRLFDATTVFLRNAAAAQPLALLIDDLHAADVPSLLLLQFVAREVAGARLLIVATFREAELLPRPQVAELAAAEQLNDLGRVEKLKEEIDFLARQLNAAVNLYGKDRKVGAAAERARLMVTKRIKSVLKTIDTLHPPLAHHLRACVKTGYYCAYTPPPSQPVEWQT